MRWKDKKTSSSKSHTRSMHIPGATSPEVWGVVVLGLADAGQEGWRQDTGSQGHVGNARATTGEDPGRVRLELHPLCIVI